MRQRGRQRDKAAEIQREITRKTESQRETDIAKERQRGQDREIGPERPNSRVAEKWKDRETETVRDRVA